MWLHFIQYVYAILLNHELEICVLDSHLEDSNLLTHVDESPSTL